MRGLVSKGLYCADLFVGQHFIRFGTKLYRQVVGIPMGINRGPLVADLFLFCCDKALLLTLHSDIWMISYINNIYFDNMVNQINPSELQLNKANTLPLILKPHFWTCIWPFLMILFLPKFTINITILNLSLLISHFKW